VRIFANLFRVYLLIGFLAMIPTRASASDALYPLLVASIAESRGFTQIALKEYLNVIRLTKNTALAEQSTLLAIQHQDQPAALALSSLWAAYDPRNLDAQVVALIVHIEESADQGMPYLSRATEINPKQATESLQEVASLLSDNGLQHLRMAALKLAQLNAHDPSLQLIAAFSAAASADIRHAMLFVNHALARQPDLTEAILLKARLIQHEEDSETAALRYLRTQITAFPQDAKLRFFYANALMDHAAVDQAFKQLEILSKDTSYGGFSAILMGDYYVQQGQMLQATKALEKALAFDNAKTSAQYRLGSVAEQQHQLQEALHWYLMVDTGPYHIAARLRVIDLLKNEKAFDQAMAYLEEAKPQTLDEQKQLLLQKVELLQLSDRAEEAFDLAHKLLENLPDDTSVLESLKDLNIPLQASD
jgi:Tfp pilus assembly protein PilF